MTKKIANNFRGISQTMVDNVSIFFEFCIKNLAIYTILPIFEQTTI